MPANKLRLLQDRALRDAAKQVVTTDLALMRADLAQGGVANRAAETGTDYLKLLGEGALDMASDNRGKLAGGVVALALAGIAAWVLREQIGEVVAGFFESDDDDDAEPEAPQTIAGEESQTIAEHE